MASNLKSPISYMMGAYDDSPNSIILQAISFLFLGYMSLCTYWSIFRINISWAYQLQGPQFVSSSFEEFSEKKAIVLEHLLSQS